METERLSGRYETNSSLKKETKMTKRQQEQYNQALRILSELENEGMIVWQTYTKDDLKSNLGKSKITKEQMSELQYQMSNATELFEL